MQTRENFKIIAIPTRQNKNTSQTSKKPPLIKSFVAPTGAVLLGLASLSNYNIANLNITTNNDPIQKRIDPSDQDNEFLVSNTRSASERNHYIIRGQESEKDWELEIIDDPTPKKVDATDKTYSLNEMDRENKIYLLKSYIQNFHIAYKNLQTYDTYRAIAQGKINHLKAYIASNNVYIQVLEQEIKSLERLLDIHKNNPTKQTSINKAIEIKEKEIIKINKESADMSIALQDITNMRDLYINNYEYYFRIVNSTPKHLKNIIENIITTSPDTNTVFASRLSAMGKTMNSYAENSSEIDTNFINYINALTLISISDNNRNTYESTLLELERIPQKTPQIIAKIEDLKNKFNTEQEKNKELELDLKETKNKFMYSLESIKTGISGIEIFLNDYDIATPSKDSKSPYYNTYGIKEKEILFEKANGQIDEYFDQSLTNDCYLMAPLKALQAKGKLEFVNKIIDGPYYDPSKGQYMKIALGTEAPINVYANEVSNFAGAIGDPDVQFLEVAINKYLIDNPQGLGYESSVMALLSGEDIKYRGELSQAAIDATKTEFINWQDINLEKLIKLKTALTADEKIVTMMYKNEYSRTGIPHIVAVTNIYQDNTGNWYANIIDSELITENTALKLDSTCYFTIMDLEPKPDFSKNKPLYK